MKKVLFVTTRLIYPTTDGRKVVLYNYCKELYNQHDCEIRLFSLIDNDSIKNTQPNFISKVYYAKLPSKIEKIKNLSIHSFILNKWPLQVSVYYSKKTKKRLNKIIEEYNPDIVISDMARTAEYLKDLDSNKYNKILDMDDLLSKRYYRQLESEVISSNSIGAYSNKLPKFLRKLTSLSFIMRSIILKEAKLLEKYEISISKFFKSVIFVSPIEAKEFNRKINSDKSIAITIGVDYDYFSKQVIERKKNNYIAYLGNMYVAHNKDSVNWFLENIFPQVLKKINNCTFRIVGKCPDDYKKILEMNKNVEVTGEVDDIRKYIQECNISVAPLKYGTGIKTKILETMAMGVPVITNDIGNEGLGLTSNKEIIIANTEEVLVKEIEQLLLDDKLKDNIVSNANSFIICNHTWSNIAKKFEEII